MIFDPVFPPQIARVPAKNIYKQQFLRLIWHDPKPDKLRGSFQSPKKLFMSLILKSSTSSN